MHSISQYPKKVIVKYNCPKCGKPVEEERLCINQIDELGSHYCDSCSALYEMAMKKAKEYYKRNPLSYPCTSCTGSGRIQGHVCISCDGSGKKIEQPTIADLMRMIDDDW